MREAVSNAFMAFPTPVVGLVKSFVSQKEKEHVLRSPVAPHSPLSFLIPPLLPGENHLQRATPWVSGRSYKFKISMIQTPASCFYTYWEQQNGESMLRNRVLLHQLGVTFSYNQHKMPQLMPEDKCTPFQI